MIVAVIVAILLFIHNSKYKMKPTVQDECVALFGADIPFVIMGAILHNKIVYADSFQEFIDLLHKDTGIAFLGGFIGGFIGFIILFQFMLKGKIKMKVVMDLIAPSIMIGHAIGRIGCLMGGCCFGRPFSWGICYEEGTPAYQMYGEQKLFPSQILEALALCVLFMCTYKMKKNQAIVYLISYSILRFLLEFMRGDYRGIERWTLSPAQIIALSVFGVSLCWVCISRLVIKEKDSVI